MVAAPTPALEMGKTVLGLSEGKDRAALMDYLTTGGANLDPATTAWCAAFVNATLNKVGMEGTGSNMARSFLEWGEAVKGTPQPGDVAVYPRGKDPRFGHVGFVEAVDPQTGMVTVLGGNQSDMVKQNQYALDAALGYRRAPGGPVEAAGGGAGNEAGAMPPTTVRHPPNPTVGTGDLPAPVATAEEKPTSWWDKLGKSVGAGAKAYGKSKGFSYDVPQQPGPARVDVGAAPIIDTQAAEMRRQQLAAVMARLNQGTLF